MSSLFNGPVYVGLGDLNGNEIIGAGYKRKVAKFAFNGEHSVNKYQVDFKATEGYGSPVEYILVFYGKTDSRPTLLDRLDTVMYLSIGDILRFSPGAIKIKWQ